jgi:hypothetical protein
MSEQITNCESKITKIIDELSNGNVLDFNEYREDIEQKIQNYAYDSDGCYKDIVLSKYDKKYKKFGSIIMKNILDYDIGLNFISINPRALEFYPDELTNSTSIVLGAIKKDIRVFQFAGYKIKSDREFGLYIVQNKPSMFKYLGQNLKSDKELALGAINNFPDAFTYVSEDLKLDKEVAFVASTKNEKNFINIGYKLKYDKEFIISMIKSNPKIFKEILPFYQNDKEIAQIAIDKDLNMFEYAGISIKDDRDIVLTIITSNPRMFQYLSPRLKSDKDIVLEVANKIPYMFCYASPELKSDIEFILRIKSQEILYYISDELYTNSKFLVQVILNWEMDFIKIIKNKRLSPNYPIENKVIEEIGYKLKLLYLIDVLEKEYIYLDQSNITDIYEMCIGFIN